MDSIIVGRPLGAVAYLSISPSRLRFKAQLLDFLQVSVEGAS